MQQQHSGGIGSNEHTIAHILVKLVQLPEVHLDRLGILKPASQVIEVKVRQDALVQSIHGVPDQRIHNAAVDVDGEDAGAGEADVGW